MTAKFIKFSVAAVAATIIGFSMSASAVTIPLVGTDAIHIRRSERHPPAEIKTMPPLAVRLVVFETHERQRANVGRAAGAIGLRDAERQ